MAGKAIKYDRSSEDLGNIVGLEHFNLLISDQKFIFFV